MVVPLGPGKFYGTSLPRPRFYANPDRVDPPVSVMDPLLSWAEEAHWSMGGLSFKRLRLQGRIEGNVDRLRKQRENQAKTQIHGSPDVGNGKTGKDVKRVGSVSPPPAPKVVKRKRYVDLFDEEEDDEVVGKVEVGKVEVGERRRPARKLVGDFDRVAKESERGERGVGGVGVVKTRRKLKNGGGSDHGSGGGVGDVIMKVVEEVNRENTGRKLKGGKKGKDGGDVSGSGIRSSPRLAKKKSS